MPKQTPTLLLLLPFVFCLTVGAQAQVSQRLVGAWELVSYEIIAADGTRRPGAYDSGQISYDASGRMSAHLMHSSNTADQTPQTDEARAAAYRRYLGYYGPFVVESKLRGIAAGAVLRALARPRTADAVAARRQRPDDAGPGLETHCCSLNLLIF